VLKNPIKFGALPETTLWLECLRATLFIHRSGVVAQATRSTGLRRQPGAAFGTATRQNLASTLACHPGSEAVCTLAAQVAWLECAFHRFGLGC
jgi:hypothetical protein